MMLVTILLVSLTAALPSVYVEGQRQREEELIFRGNQYARAIAFFRRRFNRFPASVNELLQTNGIRFLRRAYPDPMAKDGKWRFIRAAANGAVFNSRTLPGAVNDGKKSAESSSADSMANDRRSLGFRDNERRPLGFFSDSKNNNSNNDDDEKGSFIAGVASTSDKESIRVWKNRTHYDEWEFLGSDFAPAGAAAQPARRPTGPGGGRPPLRPSPPRPPTPATFPPDQMQ